jgi:uncharacterized protein (TIGR00304 family)
MAGHKTFYGAGRKESGKSLSTALPVSASLLISYRLGARPVEGGGLISKNVLRQAMRVLRVLAAGMLVAGASLMVYALLTGQMQIALALFFIPVIYGSSLIGGLAIGLIVLGIFLWMADLFVQVGRTVEEPSAPGPGQMTQERTKKEFGGVVLIGPVPVVFGSSGKAALYATIAAIIVLIVLVLALYFL